MARYASRSLPWAALVLGFSIGGFFDGILLHQILQWHHLLSDVDAVRDMRMQLAADGLFHALMYLLAMVGLYGLWRSRTQAMCPGAGHKIAGGALVGFGAWHVTDAVLSHWITGIHRIKSDSLHPLAWDIAWCVVFGVLPAVIGWMVNSRGQGGSGNGRRVASMLGALVLVAGPLAALPGGSGAGEMVVLFLPGTSSSQAFDALASVDARVVWTERSGGVWVVHVDDPGRSWALYQRGAMLVSQGAVSLGCLSWTRPRALAAPCGDLACTGS